MSGSDGNMLRRYDRSDRSCGWTSSANQRDRLPFDRPRVCEAAGTEEGSDGGGLTIETNIVQDGFTAAGVESDFERKKYFQSAITRTGGSFVLTDNVSWG